MKIRNNAIVCILSFILIVLLFSSTAMSKDKVIELKFSHHSSPMSSSHKVYVEWAKMVEERTQGRVKVTIYPSASLVKMADFYSSTIAGICDISFAVMAYEPKMMALNNVVAQPAVGCPAGEKGIQVYEELLNKFPEMRAELGEVKVLWHYVAYPSSIHTTKKEVRIPDDIRGLKMIVTGPNAEFMRLAGASPIDLGSTDWYTSLERGLGEGMIMGYYVPDMRGTLELMPYHLNIDIGPNAFAIIMNLDKWNSLPSDIKKIMDDCNAWAQKKNSDVAIEAENKSRSKAQKLGHTIIDPTPEELQLWLDLGLPMAKKWIDENEAKGKPARAVFEEAQRLAKEYRQ